MANPNSIASAIISGNKGSKSGSSLSPLVQSYQQENSFNQPFNALPRTNETFTLGSFTPGGPLEPAGINPPRDGDKSGRPDPRRTQFPINWNLPLGQPGSEGLKLANFATLRAAADEYSVARACINRRIQEIASMKWEIVPTDSAELKMRNSENKRKDFDKRKKQVVDFFNRPDSDRAKFPTFTAWLASLLEDLAVVDAVAIHLRPPRVKKSGPFGSDLASLDLIDATTIRPMLNTYGSTPAPPNVAYQQYLWGVPRVDLTTVITEADLDVMDDPVQEYRADQLIYLRYTPRNWTPYGFSWVEQAILPISIGLARQQYQWNYYQENTIPGQFITAGPDIATPQQIRQFQDALNALAGDQAQLHKIVVLPPGSSTKDMKPINLADQFDEWIVSTVTMAFGLTPQDIGVASKIAMIQGQPAAKEAAAAASDPGAKSRIEPVANWLKESIFDFVIQNIFKQEDMEWSWGKGNASESKADIIDQHVQQISFGLESVDEGRMELGRAPWGLPETSVPLAWNNAGPIPLSNLTSETGDMVDPQPGQADNLGPKPTDDQLVTPAHGQKPTPEVGPKNPPQATHGDASNPKELPGQQKPVAPLPASKRRSEIAKLARYLDNGKDPGQFQSAVLSEEDIRAVAALLKQQGE